MVKFVSSEEAVNLIQDGMTTATVGFTLMGVAEEILSEIERSFLQKGSPKSLTLLHAAGQSDTKNGLEHFAHEGLLKRIIGSHWGFAPQISRLIQDNKIEAYALPQGRIVNLYKAMGGGAPGLLSPIGLNTFVDPRVEGGKMNLRTQNCEHLVELLEVNKRPYLFYKAIPVDIAIMRGTTADENGNITMEEEAVKLEALSAALAAHRFGGMVIVQVKRVAKRGSFHPKEIIVPGIFVDAVVVVKSPENHHRQTAGTVFDPSYNGDIKTPEASFQSIPLNIRKVIGRRAIQEVKPGAIINLGTGIPGDTVGHIGAEEGILNDLVLTVESGTIGGIPEGGTDFGIARNPEAIINHMDQFDFYTGCGVDVTFMGAAEVDKEGNVNASKFGSRVAGCGGFIDITQMAKKVVFCLSFTVGRSDINVEDGRLKIKKDGLPKKFLPRVNQISFSGEFANQRSQRVLYVTERAVFELTSEGLTLTEIAPGVDLYHDVLEKMQFKPKINPHLKQMSSEIFQQGPMGLNTEFTYGGIVREG